MSKYSVMPLKSAHIQAQNLPTHTKELHNLGA